LTNAAGAALNLNAWTFCPGEAIGYRFNGGDWRTYDCPFPLANGMGDGNIKIGDCNQAARAVTIPVDLADLKQGDNTVELMTTRKGDSTPEVVVANIELTVTPKE